MTTYDSKLAEWFKQVEAQEQELKKKRVGDDLPLEGLQDVVEEREAQAAEADTQVQHEHDSVVQQDTSVALKTPEAPGATLADNCEDAAPAESELAPESVIALEGLLPQEDRSDLFDDLEGPQVEDFLSFLGRQREQEKEPFDVPFEETRGIARMEPLNEASVEDSPELPFVEERIGEPETLRPPIGFPQGTSIPPTLVEGTGEPLPIDLLRQAQHEGNSGAQQENAQQGSAVQPKTDIPAGQDGRMQPQHKDLPNVAPAPEPAKPEARNVVEAVVKPAATAPQEPDADMQAKWDRMPHHLQMLFGADSSEVAQNSYKTFKENRGQLIQRLLDPVISLEEAARVLNVCPTTVRRYTNRGALKHIRTAGNQRRFRLSDVLTFMETSTRKTAE